MFFFYLKKKTRVYNLLNHFDWMRIKRKKKAIASIGKSNQIVAQQSCLTKIKINCSHSNYCSILFVNKLTFIFYSCFTIQIRIGHLQCGIYLKKKKRHLKRERKSYKEWRFGSVNKLLFAQTLRMSSFSIYFAFLNLVFIICTKCIWTD